MLRRTSNIVRLLTNKRRHRVWTKIVGGLACVVVFVTTYALILPAITMEKKSICGIEEHMHAESCYKVPEGEIHRALICSLEQLGVHQHTPACYREDRQLICGYADYVVHQHNADCYDDGALVCPLPEIYPHIHTDTCYAPVDALPEPTPEVHVHDENCYEFQQVLVCELPECEGHLHSNDCYSEDGALACDLEESEPHFHSELCYETQQTLICGMEESLPATDEVPEQPAGRELICQIPEVAVHTHSAECFDGGTRICGLLETYAHTHDHTCFYETQDEPGDPVLTCGLEEHTHTDECYDKENVPEPTSDPTADVETAAQWEATLHDIRLTGEYRQDLLAIAHSQLGYAESTRNFVLDPNGFAKGYTRYGAWYGDPYGDWCAMFVSFCLHYAGVPETELPLEGNCENWVSLLRQQGSYTSLDGTGADEAHPEAGDLIFFSNEGSGVADHVGLVTGYQPATENAPACVETIEGNKAKAVRTAVYETTDSRILGYAKLPAQTFHCGKTGHVHTTFCDSGCTLEEHVHTAACLDPTLADGTFSLSATTESGVVVTLTGEASALPYPAETLTLTATEITNEQAEQLCQQALADEGLYAEKNYLFDVCLWHDGEQVEPTGPVTLTFSGFAEDAESYKVYHIDEQTAQTTDMHAAYEEGGSVQLDTDHFSTYSVSPLAAVSAGNEIQGAADLVKLKTSGEYQLTDNITFDEQIVIKQEVTLDLNGHTLTWTGGSFNKYSPIRIIQQNGATGDLTIEDSSKASVTQIITQIIPVATDSIPSYEDDKNKFKNMAGSLADYNAKTNKLTYYITKSNVNGSSSTSEVREKYIVNFTNYGAIQCTAKEAPVCLIGVEQGCSLTVSGGRFTNTYGETSIKADGGNVYIGGGYLCGNDSNALTNWIKDHETFNAKDLKIDKNYTGGAIHSEGNGVLEIYGSAVIAGNIAKRGGGIYKEGGTLNISGGVISGNLLTNQSIEHDNPKDDIVVKNCLLGGGVCVNNATTSFTGGYITNNQAEASYFVKVAEHRHYMGGGIAQWGGTLEIGGEAVVTGNYCFQGGGGVAFCGSNFSMTGGKVSSNLTCGLGGGICLYRPEDDNAFQINPYLISSGYITNNVMNSNNYYWGGGGIFVSDNLILKMEKSYISKNTAMGYGGGVAGCHTSTVYSFTDEINASAIFDNYSYANPVVIDKRISEEIKNQTCDFFSMNACILSAQMLGNRFAGWSGYNTEIGKIESLGGVSKFVGQTALTANPSQEAKAAALAAAKVFVTGNYAAALGGGVMTNGHLILSDADDAYFTPGLQINLDKILRNADGEKIPLASRKFKFLLLNTQPTFNGTKFIYQPEHVLDSKEQDSHGEVSFDISFDDLLQGTKAYTYYVLEDAISDRAYDFDRAVYKVSVTVTAETKELQIKEDHTLNLHYSYVSNISVSLVEGNTYDDLVDSSICEFAGSWKYNQPATVLLRRTTAEASFENRLKNNAIPMYLDVSKIDSVTKDPLPGVTFTLRNTSNPDVSRRMETGPDGIASFALSEAPYTGETCTFWLEETPPKDYSGAGPWIIEITKDSNANTYTAKFYSAYKMDDRLLKKNITPLNEQTVSPTNQYVQFSYTVENTPIPVSHNDLLRIIKTDGESQIPLAGVEFRLGQKGVAGYERELTGRDGVAEFGIMLNPDAGQPVEYWLKEMDYPNYGNSGPWIIRMEPNQDPDSVGDYYWHVMLYQAQAHDLADDDTIESIGIVLWEKDFYYDDLDNLVIEIPIENFTNQPDTLRIHKVDSKTGKPLPDVTFKLYDPAAKKFIEPTQSATNKNGDIEFQIRHLHNDNEQGNYDLYWLYEDNTPIGYKPAGPWVISVESDYQKGTVMASIRASKEGANGNLLGDGPVLDTQLRQPGDNGSFSFTLRVENKPLVNALVLRKTDSNTGTAINGPFTFSLCKEHDYANRETITVTDISEMRFDLSLPEDTWEPDLYWLYEEEAPEGYIKGGPWIISVGRVQLSESADIAYFLDLCKGKETSTDPSTSALVPEGSFTRCDTISQSEDRTAFNLDIPNTRMPVKVKLQKIDSMTDQSMPNVGFKLCLPGKQDSTEWKSTSSTGYVEFDIDWPSEEITDYWLMEKTPAGYTPVGPWVLTITKRNGELSAEIEAYAAKADGTPDLDGVLNTGTMSFNVKTEGNMITLRRELYNTRAGKLEIKKVDSISGKALSGAIFQLAPRPWDDSRPVWSNSNPETTGNDGLARFELALPDGQNNDDVREYWLKETPPEGYEPAGPWILTIHRTEDFHEAGYTADLQPAGVRDDGTFYPLQASGSDAVSVKPDGKTFKISFDLANTPTSPNELTLRKIDSDTNTEIGKAFQFSICRANDAGDRQTITNSNPTVRIPTPQNEVHTYWLYEETAPEGYVKGGPWVLEIYEKPEVAVPQEYVADLYLADTDASGRLVKVGERISSSDAPLTDGKFALTLDVPNMKQSSYALRVKKIDSETKKVMPGVEFTLTYSKTGRSWTQRTGDDGYVCFELPYVPTNSGATETYTLKETVPNGYSSGAVKDQWSIVLSYSNSQVTAKIGNTALDKTEDPDVTARWIFNTEIPNHPTGDKLQITKTDSSTATPMSGVQFRLCKEDDATHAVTVVTGEDGKATFPLGQLGTDVTLPVTYWLFETPQPGYSSAGPWALTITELGINRYSLTWGACETDENGYPAYTVDKTGKHHYKYLGTPETATYTRKAVSGGSNTITFQLAITNTPTPELPQTGGESTQWYTFSAMAVMVGAIAAETLRYRKRKRRKEA